MGSEKKRERGREGDSEKKKKYPERTGRDAAGMNLRGPKAGSMGFGNKAQKTEERNYSKKFQERISEAEET